MQKQKLFLFVGIFLVLAFVFSFVSAGTYTCYQESANVSNQAGTDGNCGLNYSGGYTKSGFFSNLDLIYDGDWVTPGNIEPGSSTSILYINYSTPQNFLSLGNVWRLKYDSAQIADYVLDSKCFYHNRLALKIYANCPSETISISCFNGSTWLASFEDLGVYWANYYAGSWCDSASGIAPLYEEAMIWNVTDVVYPIFSNYSSNNGSFFNSGLGIFNVSVLNTNGTVWLEVNGTNVSASDVSYCSGTSSYSCVQGVIDGTCADGQDGVCEVRFNSGNGLMECMPKACLDITETTGKTPITKEANCISASCTWNSGLYSANYSFIFGGNYNYKWWAYGNGSTNNLNSSSSYGYSVLSDLNAPNITLISPSDGASFSEGTVTFSFNVTDANNISSCSLIINNAVSLTNSTIFNITSVSFSKSLSAGSYSWKINCSDILNNSINTSSRSLTITSSNTGTTGGTTGGSGGGIAPYAVYPLNNQEFNNGLSKDLDIEDRFKFNLGNETHYAILISLSNSSAEIEIRSTVKRINLSVGESKMVDVNDDNIYDVLVAFIMIVNNRAQISIKSINNSIVLTNPRNQTSLDSCKNGIKDSNETGIDCGGSCASCEEKQKNSNLIKIILILVLATIAVIIIIFLILFRFYNPQLVRAVYNFSDKNPFLTWNFLRKSR